jgi:hypothetical protein
LYRLFGDGCIFWPTTHSPLPRLVFHGDCNRSRLSARSNEAGCLSHCIETSVTTLTTEGGSLCFFMQVYHHVSGYLPEEIRVSLFKSEASHYPHLVGRTDCFFISLRTGRPSPFQRPTITSLSLLSRRSEQSFSHEDKLLPRDGRSVDTITICLA